MSSIQSSPLLGTPGGLGLLQLLLSQSGGLGDLFGGDIGEGGFDIGGALAGFAGGGSPLGVFGGGPLGLLTGGFGGEQSGLGQISPGLGLLALLGR